MNKNGKEITIIELPRRGPIFCSHIQAVLDEKKERIIKILLHTKDGILESYMDYCEGFVITENYQISLQKATNGLMFFSVNELSIAFSEGIIEENIIHNTNILKIMLIKLNEIRKKIQKECAIQIERANNISGYERGISDSNILKKITKKSIGLLTGNFSKREANETEDNIEFFTKLIEEVEKVINYYSEEQGKETLNIGYVENLNKVKIELIDLKTRLEKKLKAEKAIMEIYGINQLIMNNGNKLEGVDQILIDGLDGAQISEIKYGVGDEVAKVIVGNKEIEAVVDEYQITIQSGYIYGNEEHLIGLMATNRSLFTLYVGELEVTIDQEYGVENLEEITNLLKNTNSILRTALARTIEIANNQVEQEDRIKEAEEMRSKYNPMKIKNHFEVKLLDSNTCREIVEFDEERAGFLNIVIKKIEEVIDSLPKLYPEELSNRDFNLFINELRNTKLLINSITRSVRNRQKSVRNIMEVYSIKEK